ncbi:unnamed protein product [Spirodela intermedia]|uniref:Uncharacterized protein n=1 Tax=Spirodela intermedia TaxID=51605 RepID=A0ABN7EC35_SPIIN|nr:unnamed protein product [Spirodela intermedia]
MLLLASDTLSLSTRASAHITWVPFPSSSSYIHRLSFFYLHH